MELETLSIVVSYLVILAILLVVIALLRALAETARATPLFRIPAALIGALTVFIVMRAAIVWADVQLRMLSGLMEGNLLMATTEIDFRPEEVRYEMWVREINPVPGTTCYTSENSCTWADDLTESSEHSKGELTSLRKSMSPYRMPFEIAPAIFTAGVFLLITRRRDRIAPQQAQ